MHAPRRPAGAGCHHGVCLLAYRPGFPLSYFLAFAGFAALIILHEFGHFAAAKAVGMRVERFALFFPPLIAKLRRGETEYGIGAIPLGGYVRITGMNPNEEIPPEIAPRAYFRQPVWKRVVVIAAGPAMNLVIAFVILWALFLANGLFTDQLVVGRAEPGAPAAQVLKPGDRLLSVDGRPGYAPGQSESEVVAREKAIADAINRHQCPVKPPRPGCRGATPVTVVVQRDGRRVTLRIAPVYDAKLHRMRLGFAFGAVHQNEGPLGAARLSVNEMWRVTTATVSAIGRLFYSEQARKQVSGVVGSYEATRQSFEFDTTRALWILALISLSLAVVNLFPFLPLDGGHIFWALVEKLRGRPVPFSVMERASVIGIALVGFLFIVGLMNDLHRLSGPGFGVR
jgi:regulator of sigma E protease